jgi:hypothetical protein
VPLLLEAILRAERLAREAAQVLTEEEGEGKLEGGLQLLAGSASSKPRGAGIKEKGVRL